MNSILGDIGRRAFVERFAKAVFGVSLLPATGALRAAEGKVGGEAKSVIFLYMRGGISHIDTFDPKPGKPEMGGVQAIATSADGVQISEWFPRTAKQMHHVALVRSATAEELAEMAALTKDSPAPEQDIIWALLNSPEFLFNQ